MSDSKFMDIYNFQSAEYHRGLQAFFDHTDQKAKTFDWFSRLVQRLPSWRVFIDAGAGNGQITCWFIEKFQRTIVIEPNPSFRDELRRTCLTAEVLPEMILEAHLPDLADLILCSHVFYHIDSAAWMPHLEKLVSWLSSDGMLVVVLQNHDTDCMRMLDYFSGQRFALSELARRFQAAQGNHYQVDFETVPAKITTMDLDSAYLIAEFMLNGLPIPMPHIPTRVALEDYVRKHFADPEGGFRFSCDQDFLQIRPQP